jgi:hypothetical protein
MAEKGVFRLCATRYDKTSCEGTRHDLLGQGRIGLDQSRRGAERHDMLPQERFI